MYCDQRIQKVGKEVREGGREGRGEGEGEGETTETKCGERLGI